VRLLVADSGPLIVLARIGRTDLLGCVADRILVPQPVAAECTRDLALPGAKTLSGLLESLPFQVESVQPPDFRFPESLGAGERAALALADEKSAGLLMDDLGARRFATQRGLAVLGVPGLLLLAKQKGAIPWVRPLLESLNEQKYFLSPGLRAEVLRRAGE
jgi:predicted nucleic acid-binding protein